MRIFRGWKKPSSMRRITILVIAGVLAVAVAACDGAQTCQLTISSTTGGSVTLPGEGTFAYDIGTVVELVATPEDGHGFHTWTGDVEKIADTSSASTNITMDGDHSISASFEEGDGPGPTNPF